MMPATSYNDLVLEGEALIETLREKFDASTDRAKRSGIGSTIQTIQQAINCVNSCTTLTMQDMAAHALKTLIDVVSKSKAFD